MSLATTLNLTIQGDHKKTMEIVPSIRDNLNKSYTDSMATGTATDQSDVLWHDQRSLAATSETIDLAGTLTNAFGETVTIADLRCLVIKNNNTTAGHDLTIGGAAASAVSSIFGSTTDTITVQADGALLLWAPKDGYAVTSATADLIKIDAGAATVSYDIIMIGTSS